jgi:glycosyltransferase involved in cell wall biosynthesis
VPQVSVIMPVYNAAAYLSTAIDSILSQTFTDFELLILDDGSTDTSIAIARRAAARDDRVVVIAGEHYGVVHWRNTGVRMATSELLAMMDADDISLRDRLAQQVRFLEANPDCGVVGTQAMRVDCDGLPINEWHVPLAHMDIDCEHMAGRGGAIVNPSVMMRKTAVCRIGGYRQGFDSSEDYDLFLRLAEICQLANLPQVLVHYRVHAKSLTCAGADFQHRMARKALEEAWERRGKSDPCPAAPPFVEAASDEELMWSWARSAFAARHFRTARRQAFRVLRRRPSDLRRWVLFGAACLGPASVHLRRICSYRVGAYVPSRTTENLK